MNRSCLVTHRNRKVKFTNQIQRRRTGVPAPHQSRKSFPVFLYFPQRSLILHSFCTTEHQFSVAIESAFAHSAPSANVRCIEPARDCSRAGGDRRFSRVNHREGFQKCASVRSRKLGRCGLLRESFPKKLDWRRPLTHRRRPMSANLVFADGLPAGCLSERALFRECGFLSTRFAA